MLVSDVCELNVCETIPSRLKGTRDDLNSQVQKMKDGDE